MISIVCVYNNEEILNKYLIKSLKSQTEDYELILLDNTNKKFKSAAEALNFGGKKANGNYIMFVHQDVDLYNDHFLKDAENCLNSLSHLGIGGVAGKSKDRNGVITNIKHGYPLTYAGEFQIKKPYLVQTLDECLILIPKSVFKLLEFDEDTCNDWHLYSVDFCLSLNQLKLNAYVLPLPIYHVSNAFSFNEEFFVTLEKLLKKHRKKYSWIYTTMNNWNTKISVKIQKTNVWYFFLKVLKK